MDQVAQDHQKKSGSVFGINNNVRGFTFLELLVVLLIIGIIGSVVVPALNTTTPRYEREQFIAGLNALMQTALSMTVSSHMMHQIYFNFKTREISIRQHTGAYTRDGEPEIKPIMNAYLQATQTIPDQFVFKQFIIEGINEMRSEHAKTNEIWFYIVPEGLAQHVTINMLDTNDTIEGEKPRPIGLVLNPFTAQFKVYDAFQK